MERYELTYDGETTEHASAHAAMQHTGHSDIAHRQDVTSALSQRGEYSGWAGNLFFTLRRIEEDDNE